MGRTMFDVRSSFVRRQKLGVQVRLLTDSDGSNTVRSLMFECSKPKIGVRVRLPKDEHVQCPFDVRSTVRRTFNEHQTTIKECNFP